MTPTPSWNHVLARDLPAPDPSAVARGNALQHWSLQAQKRYVNVSDSQGDFNGTCDSTESNFPLDAAEGQCASYYPDITSYCCAAVGGILQEMQLVVGDNSTEAQTSSNSSDLEPICETTNYADMLDCYKYVAETHCRSAVVGPWGVCHPAHDKVDTSRSVQHSSGSSLSPSPTGLLILCLVLSSLGISIVHY
ncbi:hypothetical protein FA10DRAFT_264591 [Acaromyces ingoldii]|uniref:Uncharacterized protein n=1 Tax=Acaromyces ingoldii TaxID=215250 RepID=A0A316YY64_9BASI|nr:hypothetical protein FA10DRAFT_264591 [Acaromyces ingoldii]PWN93996.1 hypothetical protein FA10DRAFT_264591 [Acaromyces ingoldii]